MNTQKNDRQKNMANQTSDGATTKAADCATQHAAMLCCLIRLNGYFISFIITIQLRDATAAQDEI